jgi:hypothetical protein
MPVIEKFPGYFEEDAKKTKSVSKLERDISNKKKSKEVTNREIHNHSTIDHSKKILIEETKTNKKIKSHERGRYSKLNSGEELGKTKLIFFRKRR